MKQKIFWLYIVLISLVYLFLRLNDLNSFLSFRLDQGIHLLETKTMFDTGEFRLLGPMVTSKEFMGRNFFLSVVYYLVLGVFGFVAQWEPLIITAIIIVFEFLFYLFFTNFLRHKFGAIPALVIFFFLSISPYLLTHSHFIWNPHFVIPFSILVIYFLDKFLSQNQLKFLLFASFFWGLAFAFHYTTIFWMPIFVYFLFKSGRLIDLKSFLLVSLGFLIPNLPLILFELRNNFYNIRTLLFIMANSAQKQEFDSSHYYVFPLLVFIIYFLLKFLSQIKSKALSFILLILITGSIWLYQFNYYRNVTTQDIVPGWFYPEQNYVTDLIVKNGCPQNFNVAATMQGDTRFYDLRYLLNLKKCDPMPVDAYPTAKTIFLVAPVTRPPETETVWEISSFKPFKTTQKIKLNDQLYFYQLDH